MILNRSPTPFSCIAKSPVVYAFNHHCVTLLESTKPKVYSFVDLIVLKDPGPLTLIPPPKVELFPVIVIGELPNVSPSGVHIATVFKVPEPAGTPGIAEPSIQVVPVTVDTNTWLVVPGELFES